jgi:TATA-binding protein-associated factor
LCFLGIVQELTLRRLQDQDDDVRGAAASTLVPLVDAMVASLPERTNNVAAVLWHCLGELGDDLASSVAAVMNLLSRLFASPAALVRLQATEESVFVAPRLHSLPLTRSRSFTARVPLLYPFFRHTLSSVRLAVVSLLAIFLRLPADRLGWLDDKPLGLIFQNVVFEERPGIRDASVQAWLLACIAVPPDRLCQSAIGALPNWFATLSTPIGTPMDRSLLYTPPAAAASYNVDKPVLDQDLRLAPVSQIVTGRLAGISALAFLLAKWPDQVGGSN